MERNAVKKILRYSIISLFALVILGYSLYQSKNLIQGPGVAVIRPENGAAFDASLIEIEGQAHNVTLIDINGRPIFIDDKGVFKEKYLLSPGYNAVTITAQDKFGRITRKILELMQLPAS